MVIFQILFPVAVFLVFLLLQFRMNSHLDKAAVGPKRIVEGTYYETFYKYQSWRYPLYGCGCLALASVTVGFVVWTLYLLVHPNREVHLVEQVTAVAKYGSPLLVYLLAADSPAVLLGALVSWASYSLLSEGSVTIPSIIYSGIEDLWPSSPAWINIAFLASAVIIAIASWTLYILAHERIWMPSFLRRRP